LVLCVFQKYWITGLCIRYLCFTTVMSARILHSLGMFLQRKWFGITAKRWGCVGRQLCGVASRGLYLPTQTQKFGSACPPL
jgi:hypothetical protein